MTVNRRVVLASRPRGVPVPENFRLESGPMPEIAEGEILVRMRAISMEPAIRGWLDDNDKNYFDPIPLGGTMRALSVGEVVASRLSGFAPGDMVRGLFGWEDYTVATAETVLLQTIEVAPDMPITYYVGVLGGSGQTAIVGLDRIGRARPGETVAISAAVGAVGHVAVQYARRLGCRVVGIVGGPEKARVAASFGCDAVVDYKSSPDLEAAIRAAAPEGVDVYFDGVGGAMLDAMLNSMKTFGRIICCGMIAGYNDAENPPPLTNAWQIVARELELKGFLLYSYAEHVPAALDTLRAGLRDGWLRTIEHKRVGLAEAGPLFCELMGGKTLGKAVLELEGPAAA
ncbi:NADP-dependent oxidoreductase [Novosphingobium piscinae]|uniref:NADP-dependent oxidoreductase n=1 Tax=Novosphingobium piscinae TaxID=1507448 RepID=A0A7X1KPR2_9SPHN|nr:NADP-dependent oxidoreductase [Novosphingobium piscinae]MBC2668997.1 NADP-dependent oxidoreductase [Novosphingobium piscinae]